MATNSTENNQTKYYDLHTRGVGYVNRVREVPVKRGEPFWACNISALHGAEDAVEYTNFDCRVSGSEAAKIGSGSNLQFFDIIRCYAMLSKNTLSLL